MQSLFEKELITKYCPYLIPKLRACYFAKEEVAFYWDQKFNVYPTALVFRPSNSEASHTPLIQFDDDVQGATKTGNYMPFPCDYSIRVFVEKQSELIALRNNVRIRYQKNPYVYLTEYSKEIKKFPIGLRLKSLGIEDIRSNQDEKGAQRVLNIEFLTHLVITDVDPIAEIEEISWTINDTPIKIQKP